MTHRMSAEIFKLSGAAFHLVPPIGGLLVDIYNGLPKFPTSSLSNVSHCYRFWFPWTCMPISGQSNDKMWRKFLKKFGRWLFSNKVGKVTWGAQSHLSNFIVNSIDRCLLRMSVQIFNLIWLNILSLPHTPPAAWSYHTLDPGHTCSRMLVDKRAFKSENFSRHHCNRLFFICCRVQY